MTFRPRKYDPDRPARHTPAQQAATMRNFGIFKLRGLWVSCCMLSEPNRSFARAAIDAELVKRGALAQDDHERQAAYKRFVKRQRQNALDEDDTVIF